MRRWHPSLGREPNSDELELISLNTERIEFCEVPVRLRDAWLSPEERALLGDYGPLNWRPCL